MFKRNTKVQKVQIPRSQLPRLNLRDQNKGTFLTPRNERKANVHSRVKHSPQYEGFLSNRKIAIIRQNEANRGSQRDAVVGGLRASMGERSLNPTRAISPLQQTPKSKKLVYSQRRFNKLSSSSPQGFTQPRQSPSDPHTPGKGLEVARSFKNHNIVNMGEKSSKIEPSRDIFNTRYQESTTQPSNCGITITPAVETRKSSFADSGRVYMTQELQPVVKAPQSLKRSFVNFGGALRSSRVENGANFDPKRATLASSFVAPRKLSGGDFRLQSTQRRSEAFTVVERSQRGAQEFGRRPLKGQFLRKNYLSCNHTHAKNTAKGSFVDTKKGSPSQDSSLIGRIRDLRASRNQTLYKTILGETMPSRELKPQKEHILGLKTCSNTSTATKNTPIQPKKLTKIKSEIIKKFANKLTSPTKNLQKERKKPSSEPRNEPMMRRFNEIAPKIKIMPKKRVNCLKEINHSEWIADKINTQKGAPASKRNPYHPKSGNSQCQSFTKKLRKLLRNKAFSGYQKGQKEPQSKNFKNLKPLGPKKKQKKTRMLGSSKTSRMNSKTRLYSSYLRHSEFRAFKKSKNLVNKFSGVGKGDLLDELSKPFKLDQEEVRKEDLGVGDVGNGLELKNKGKADFGEVVDIRRNKRVLSHSHYVRDFKRSLIGSQTAERVIKESKFISISPTKKWEITDQNVEESGSMDSVCLYNLPRGDRDAQKLSELVKKVKIGPNDINSKNDQSDDSKVNKMTSSCLEPTSNPGEAKKTLIRAPNDLTVSLYQKGNMEVSGPGEPLKRSDKLHRSSYYELEGSRRNVSIYNKKLGLGSNSISSAKNLKNLKKIVSFERMSCAPGNLNPAFSQQDEEQLDRFDQKLQMTLKKIRKMSLSRLKNKKKNNNMSSSQQISFFVQKKEGGNNLTAVDNTSTESASEQQTQPTTTLPTSNNKNFECGVTDIRKQRRQERRELMKSLKARIVSKSPSQEDCLYKKDTTFKTHMDKNKSISRFQLSKMFQSSVEKAEETESQVKKAQRKKLSKTKSEANRKFLKAISTDKAKRGGRRRGKRGHCCTTKDLTIPKSSLQPAKTTQKIARTNTTSTSSKNQKSHENLNPIHSKTMSLHLDYSMPSLNINLSLNNIRGSINLKTKLSKQLKIASDFMQHRERLQDFGTKETIPEDLYYTSELLQAMLVFDTEFDLKGLLRSSEETRRPSSTSMLKSGFKKQRFKKQSIHKLDFKQFSLYEEFKNHFVESVRNIGFVRRSLAKQRPKFEDLLDEGLVRFLPPIGTSGRSYAGLGGCKEGRDGGKGVDGVRGVGDAAGCGRSGFRAEMADYSFPGGEGSQKLCGAVCGGSKGSGEIGDGEKGRKICSVVLDLDETLVHFKLSLEQIRARWKNDSPVVAEKKLHDFLYSKKFRKYLHIRPYAKKLLKKLSRKFEIIIFTASSKAYAEAIIAILDPHRKYISHLFSRQNCYKSSENLLIKDLRVIGNRDLSRTIIVDNNIFSFGFHLQNGIPIIPYKGSTKKHDDQLKKLGIFLLGVEEDCEAPSLTNRFFARRFGYDLVQKHDGNHFCIVKELMMRFAAPAGKNDFSGSGVGKDRLLMSVSREIEL